MRISLFVIGFLISSLLYAFEYFVLQRKEGGFTWINQERAHPLLFDPVDESEILHTIQNQKRDTKKATGFASTLISTRTGAGAVIAGNDLQKIMINFFGLRQSYLGTLQSETKK